MAMDPLTKAVYNEVRNGALIEQESDDWVVTVKPLPKMSFMANLITTVFTCGLWLLVWLPVALLRHHVPAERKLFRLSDDGRRVIIEKL